MYKQKFHVGFFLIVIALLMAITPLSAQEVTFNEAPMLAELVQAGQLPPVAERLPVNPAVITPFNETGTYGGELRVGFTVGWFVVPRWLGKPGELESGFHRRHPQYPRQSRIQ